MKEKNEEEGLQRLKQIIIDKKEKKRKEKKSEN